jgi:hypothetical protein
VRPRTRVARRTEAPRYLGKAQEFLTFAATALDEGRFDSATLLAVHAGISANDAVTSAIAEVRSADPDHARAADLLEEVAGRGREAVQRAKQLRDLLGVKNQVEYLSRRAGVEDAAAAVRRAERFVAWAREQVAAAGREP